VSNIDLNRTLLFEQHEGIKTDWRPDMNKGNVGDQIIKGLEEFTAALKSDQPVTEQLNCRRIMLNLEPTPYNHELVKETRDLLGISQAVFAQFLGVKLGTVQKWEQGDNPPTGAACRFMDEIRHDPKLWRKRLRELIVPKNANPPEVFS